MSFTLINASAGSGKTYTLTHRIAERIAGGLRPSELIATTFTKKAAAELSDRVRRTLLEVGQTSAARGTDSALIGTVNSVAGELLREFALDAGISPQVQVLDQDRQKTAFSAAIDQAAAEAGARATDLLARTEHDGEQDPDLPYLSTASWRRHVRDLAARARTNQISATQLREAAESSWLEYRDSAELPEPGDDRRAAWLSELGSVIAGLQADVDASSDPDPSAGKPPLTPSAARTVAKRLVTLEQLHRNLARHQRSPWSLWAKLAGVASGKAADGGSGGYVFSKDVDQALLGLATEIETGLLANPVLQSDVRELIRLVMHTAAESLESYQRYKDELGLIDFIDQEVRTLELIRSSERAREAIRSRFRLLAVDEFQDTSPVQLALFLELSRLIEEKIWVGDPKQAIYGFRDADPTLMLGIIEQIQQGTTELGPGQVCDLDFSWRSQQSVLSLVSSVFPRVFPQLPRERVVLTPAPEAVRRRQEAGREPGRLEAWIPQYQGRASQRGHARAVADGVVSLLAEPGVGPGDLAVLVRTNSQAQQVISALAARGVPASGEGTPILASREGRILRAALAVTLDASDTLALTELVDLLDDHPSHTCWFPELARAADAEARDEIFAAWWGHEVFAGLRQLREEAISLTPVEMITALSDALDLPERIRAWSVPEQRLRTLDALRKVAAEYAEQARSDSAPITLTGLRGVLDQTERGPDLSGIPDTVWVGTIHNAKGLEWSRVVVMLEATATERPQTAGSFVVPAEQLDVTAPLQGRAPRYWPSLLGRYARLQDALSASTHAIRRTAAEREESGRLQYVALTRAADVTVLSGAGTAPVLDALVEGDEPLLSWELGDPQLHVAGADPLPAVIRGTREDADEHEDLGSYRSARSPLAPTDLGAGARGEASTPIDPTALGAEHRGLSARFQASGVSSGGSLGTVGAPHRIGEPIVDRGGRDWDRVGEAMHAYLSLPLPQLSPEQREQAAQRLVARWAVTRAVGPEALLRAGEAWQSYLEQEFPGAEVLTEQPITWWNEEDQVMEGWIDALLRLPDGSHVLVDHKTYPGSDPVTQVREHHLGQMDTYSRALSAAGARPQRVLIHLPLRGEVLEVFLAAGCGSEDLPLPQAASRG